MEDSEGDSLEDSLEDSEGDSVSDGAPPVEDSEGDSVEEEDSVEEDDSPGGVWRHVSKAGWYRLKTLHPFVTGSWHTMW